jgi:anti-anti-sigma regulatory factor
VSAREVIIEAITERTSADRVPSSRPDWHGPGNSDTELCERCQSPGAVITLRVAPPLRLVEATVLRQQVEALFAHRPAAIVLDVAGLVPDGEMGVLMLSLVARDAAAEGIAVVLANPSPALCDRLRQLGVRDLTCADRPDLPAPTEDECGLPTGGRPATTPPPRPEGSTRRGSGPLPAGTGAGLRDEALPGSPCSFCSALAITGRAR